MQIQTDFDTEESKQVQKDSQPDLSTTEIAQFNTTSIDSKSPELLAWCSIHEDANLIRIINLEDEQEYVNFEGVPLHLSTSRSKVSHIKELSNTGLLVSLNHACRNSANLEIFDVSKKGKATKIYSFEEVQGFTGNGDATYNPRRSVLGALCEGLKIAYNLFKIDVYSSEVAKLCRKAKWNCNESSYYETFAAGLDLDPSGELMAVMDANGICLVSEVNTNLHKFRCELPICANIWDNIDEYGRCRWSTNTGEPFLYVKCDFNINIFDVEKKTRTMKDDFRLEEHWTTRWIDVCTHNGDLLASAGDDKNIKLFDRRELKIVRIFDQIHSSKRK